MVFYSTMEFKRRSLQVFMTTTEQHKHKRHWHLQEFFWSGFKNQ